MHTFLKGINKHSVKCKQLHTGLELVSHPIFLNNDCYSTSTFQHTIRFNQLAIRYYWMKLYIVWLLYRMSQNRCSPLIWWWSITEKSAIVLIWNTSCRKCIFWVKDIKLMFFVLIVISASRICNLFLTFLSP